MDQIDKTNLTEQTKIRLNKITEIENYSHQFINYFNRFKENYAVKN